MRNSIIKEEKSINSKSIYICFEIEISFDSVSLIYGISSVGHVVNLAIEHSLHLNRLKYSMRRMADNENRQTNFILPKND